MNLDWNFFYDSWLIDKIPDGQEIKVIEGPNGLECKPKSLTLYFGANPIYLYGEGKLFHEVIMSAGGIGIYPEFLQRPGFEWVNRKTFSVGFNETLDFHGNNVRGLHVGRINARTYLSNIMSRMYAFDIDEDFTNITTPSSTLRKMSTDDYSLIADGVSSKQIFQNSEELQSKGCVFYSRLTVEDGRESTHELISNTNLIVKSPAAPVTVNGFFTRVLFMKYSYVSIPFSMAKTLLVDNFTVMFRTLSSFRRGTLIDFGSTNYSDDTDYGFKLSFETSLISIVMNDGTYHNTQTVMDVDFRFPHSWVIIRDSERLRVLCDTDVIVDIDTSDIGSLAYSALHSDCCISKNSVSGNMSAAGDIEELCIFDEVLEDGYVSDFLNGDIPVLKKDGASQLIAENIPNSMSYGLTFQKPTDIFIPNHFKADFFKIYLADRDGSVIVSTQEPKVDSSYRDDLEPYEDMSLLLPDGFTIDNALASGTQGIDEEVDALTKITSDTHIPIRIHMDFTVPEMFYTKETVFNMRLVLKPLAKFIWYNYKKFKTGEFI